jgi:mono/diheme cytochrome c family protein
MHTETRAMMSVSVAALLLVPLLSRPLRADATAEGTYKMKCVACHAADGSGDTPVGKKLGAHDFRSEEVQKMSDAELTEIIVKGKNKMPAYEKSLKPDEIKGLVAYIRSLAPKK